MWANVFMGFIKQLYFYNDVTVHIRTIVNMQKYLMNNLINPVVSQSLLPIFYPSQFVRTKMLNGVKKWITLVSYLILIIVHINIIHIHLHLSLKSHLTIPLS